MISNDNNLWVPVLLAIVSAGISVSFQAIRNKLKKIDEDYEKLKKECDTKITKDDLRELLELYLKPLINEISNIKDTLKNITRIKPKTD